MEMSVVFPAPFGPRSAKISPRRMSRSTPERASNAPKCLRTRRTVTTGSLIGGRNVARPGAGGRVADLGAGVGHLALPLAARGLAVAAVEPARAMLDALAAAAPPGATVTLVHAAAEATALPAASFDLAVL